MLTIFMMAIVKQKNTRNRYIIIIVIFLVIARFAVCFAEEPSKVKQNVKGPPIIIWYHNLRRDNLAVLKTVLSSGLITHVMIKPLHRNTYIWSREAIPVLRDREVFKIIEYVKKSGAKLIWSRPIWPLYLFGDNHRDDFFSSDYYKAEILLVKEEAKEIGADFAAIDLEPYANSPMKKYLVGKNRIVLSDKQYEKLESIVKTVVRDIGQIDFILPAGSGAKVHPYHILAKLGKNRINESTYYANDKMLAKLKYPYEIFGAYVNTTKANPRKPMYPYYLASEIFERSYLWSHKKGLFIYPKEHKAMQVAKELVKYSYSLPVKTK